MAADAALIEQRADVSPVIRCTGDGGRWVVESGWIRLAKALIQLIGANNCRAAGKKENEQEGEFAHDYEVPEDGVV